MKNADGRVLYVGKAVNLRRRLVSYFRTSSTPHRKSEMISRIRQIDVILVRNEREALVLESNLIRHHTPLFNSRFTHDEDSYYYIALTDEAFPRFVGTRTGRTSLAVLTECEEMRELFGPYTGWRIRNRILDAMRELFPLRICHTLPDRPCDRADQGRCLAPCAEGASVDAYQDHVRRAANFLRHPTQCQMDRWHRQMHLAADAQDYERAKTVRDWIRAVEHARLPQAVEREGAGTHVVLYLECGLGIALELRDGRVIGLHSPRTNDGQCSLETWLRTLDATVNPMSWVVNDPQRLHGAVLRGRIQSPGTASSLPGQWIAIAALNGRFRAGNHPGMK